MLDKPLAIVDIETTGMNSTWGRIIEIGVIRVENNQIVDELNLLINPKTYVSPFIESFTGISVESLEKAPVFIEVKDEIFAILSDAILVAHNVRFDYSFIRSEFKRVGMTYSAKTICTVKLSRRLFPRFRHHNLSTIIERFNLESQRRHRAYDDAFVLWQFWQKLISSFSQDKLDQIFKAILKSSYSGDEKIKSQIEELPEGPGVYIFYDEKNLPLYVGKSKNIKERVITHYTQDHQSGRELRMTQLTKRIDHIQTAGELGALLTEARLVKELLPVFNRTLRRKKQLYALIKKLTPDGYMTLGHQIINNLTETNYELLFGICKSKRSAIETMRSLSKKYRLCPKLIGVDKSKSSCFEYKLGRCKGACLGEESAEKYNLRFILAFGENKQFRSWPFAGPIEILEKNKEAELYESFIIDKWCLLQNGKMDGSRVINHVLDFDLDTYKIIAGFLKNRSINYRLLA